MPDGFETRDLQTVQRGGPGRFPGGGPGRFPGGGPGRFPGGGPGRFPRGGFPRRFPVRRRSPFPFFPIFYGFPFDRCYYIDRFGRCCDRFGRCCDRWGRCYYGGYDYLPVADAGDSWYGMPGSWDMMPDMDDVDDAYDDMDGD